MDLSSVAPNSTPPCLVNSQLVSLPPVGILNLLCLICIVFVCNVHLIIFTWNLHDINVNNYCNYNYYYYELCIIIVIITVWLEIVPVIPFSLGSTTGLSLVGLALRNWTKQNYSIICRWNTQGRFREWTGWLATSLLEKQNITTYSKVVNIMAELKENYLVK